MKKRKTIITDEDFVNRLIKNDIERAMEKKDYTTLLEISYNKGLLRHYF